MPLAPGTRLGPYTITGPIGAGGMGEVYRATDTRLDRDVAIKISSERFSDRFSREALAVAALNHPNICTLHDVGPDYLVMEYVEGRPLNGPLPVADVLRYADQIAAALDHAHSKRIVHRDLKPANILVTRQGIKLLDFGLAKRTARVTADERTVAAAITTEGTILGTLQYMSPEQLEGKEADERSDIFSFGCVLYELVTGRPAFEGTSPASLIAAILHSQPPSFEPAGLFRVVRTCLARDPDERWQTVRELRHALRWTAEEPAGSRQVRAGGARSWVPLTVAAVAGIAAAVFAALWTARRPPAAPAAVFAVDAPSDVVFNFLITGSAVSPDGRYLVFRASSGGGTPSLWVRPLNSLTARRLPGSENADFPFWSPDSASLAFLADDTLKTIALAGGTPMVLCSSVGGTNTWNVGGAWNQRGVILFGDRRGLLRVPATGGTPTLLISIDASQHETGYGYPQFLPDDNRFLYLVTSTDPNVEGVYASSLDHPETRVRILRTSTKAIFTPAVNGGADHLLFLRDRLLVAQRFDAESLRLDGNAEPLADDVARLASVHGAAFWASDTGVLAYRTGFGLDTTKLIWLSRDGKPLGEAGPPSAYARMRLSPDGTRVALGRRDPDNPGDLWVLELNRTRSSRFTFDPHVDTCPVWSPDGRRIVFTSDRTGAAQLYVKDSDGAGEEVALTSGPLERCALDWSRDGRYVLFGQSGGSFDVLAWPIQGDHSVIPVLQSAFDETDAQFSPDGHWIAYTSNESGRNEVYITAFPGWAAAPAGRWPVSNQGGHAPRWRGDGREVFYLTPDTRTVMAVDVRTSAAGCDTGTPHQLFTASMPGDTGDNPYPYDVTADGQRFLVEEGTDSSSPLTVVMNWQSKIGG